jgi:dual specificity protein kinase YAK1
LASPYGAQRALPPPPAASNSLYTQAYPMDTTSPGPSTQNSPMHLTSHSQNTLPLRQSLSTPSTPLSYHHPQSSHGQVVYQQPADDPSLMSVEVSHKRRASGFKRVRDQRDLRPYVNAQPAGRRGDTNGQFLSVSAEVFLQEAVQFIHNR